MSHADKAQTATYAFLSDRSYIEVLWGETRVSEHLLVSFGYRDCRALILFGTTHAGLSHIWGYRKEWRGKKGSDPHPYAEEIIAQLGSDVRAAVIGGTDAYELEIACDELGIPVVETYTPTNCTVPKDIVVTPSRREILVFANGDTSPKKIRL